MSPGKYWRILLAIAAGIGWLLIASVAGWPIMGMAGIVLGGVVGLTAGLAESEPIGRGSAILLAAAVPMMIVPAAHLVGQQKRASARESIEQDDSYIDAIAQQLIEDKVSEKKGEPSSAPKLSVEISPGFAPGSEIPAEVRELAVAQWRKMSAEEKEKIRHDRDRWVAATHGEQLEHFPVLPGFVTQLGICGIGAILAFASANVVGLLRDPAA